MTYRAPLYTLPTGISYDPTLGFIGTVFDTTYSEPATVVTLTDQGSASANTTALQNAINTAAGASTGGTTIVLPAGVTYNGITLKARTGDGGWIYIVSSARASLPSPQAGDEPGTDAERVSPSDAAHMPLIKNIVSAGKAVSVEAAAHHYRFVGIEMTTDPAVPCYNLCYIRLDSGMDVEANFPHHIGFDRCYLHGQTTRVDMQRTIFLAADYGFVTGCYMSDVLNTGADAQCVLMGGVHGPFKINNNYMAATGENLMVGGLDTQVAGVIASDIEVRRNYAFKPLTWNRYDPSWDGNSYVIKNTFELKNGVRVLFEGNIGQNCWLGSGQQYYMVNIKTVNQNGGSTWVETNNVTVCYNKFLNCYGGFSIAGHPETYAVGSLTSRLDIYDNLIVHGDPTLLGGMASQFAALGVSPMGPSVNFRRNTVPGQNQNTVFFAGSTDSQDLSVTDNVFRRTTVWGGAAGGIKGDGSQNPAAPNDGEAVFDAYVTTPTFAGNGFYDSAGGTTAQRNSYTTAPNTNTLIDNLDATVFVDAASNNYRLNAGIFATAARDGGAPGANQDLIDAEVAGNAVTPGPADHLGIFTQPSSSTESDVAHAVQPFGSVQDASNITVKSDTSIVTASWVNEGGTTPGVAKGTLTAQVVLGQWQFTDLGVVSRYGCTGHWHFTDGAFSVDSDTITITAAVPRPTTLHVVTQPAGAVDGEPLTTQPVVEVLDQFGDRLTTYSGTMTATVPAGNSSVASGGSVAVASGLATYTGLTLDGAAASVVVHFATGF